MAVSPDTSVPACRTTRRLFHRLTTAFNARTAFSPIQSPRSEPDDLASSPPSDYPSPMPRLATNLIVLYSGEMIAKILGFVAFAHLGRTLGEVRYGELEAALAIVFVFALAQEAGLEPYGSREASRNPTKTPRLAARIMFARALLFVVGACALFALTLGAPTDTEATAAPLLLLAGLILIPGTFVVSWAFEARDRMGVVALKSILRQMVLAAAVFLFVRDVADAWIAPVADATGLLVAAIVQQVMFRRDIGRIDPTNLVAGTKHVLRDAAPLTASTLAWALRIFFPLIALRYFGDERETGLFAAGHRLVVALHTFCWLYFVNLLPSLSRAAARPEGRDDYRRLIRRSFILVALTVIPATALLSFLAPTFLRIAYDVGYVDGAPALSIAAWFTVAAFLSGHFRYGLIAHRRSTAEFVASVAGAMTVVGGTLGLAMSTSFTLDAVSAAVVLVAGEVVTFVGAALLHRRLDR